MKQYTLISCGAQKIIVGENVVVETDFSSTGYDYFERERRFSFFNFFLVSKSKFTVLFLNQCVVTKKKWFSMLFLLSFREKSSFSSEVGIKKEDFDNNKRDTTLETLKHVYFSIRFISTILSVLLENLFLPNFEIMKEGVAIHPYLSAIHTITTSIHFHKKTFLHDYSEKQPITPLVR